MAGQLSVSGGFQQSSGADKAGSDACTGRVLALSLSKSLNNWAAATPPAVATASLHWTAAVACAE